MEHCINIPSPEDCRAEISAFNANSIQQWVLHEFLLLELKVNDAPGKDGSTSEEHIVELIDPRLVESLPTEDGEKAEIVLHDNIEEVLVKIVADDE